MHSPKTEGLGLGLGLVNYTTKELQSLLEDPNAHVHLKKNVGYPIRLTPSCLGDVKAAIIEILNGEVTTYLPKYRGILLSYKNVKLVSDTGTIINDDYHINIRIRVDFYIFAPNLNCTLSGIVSKKSVDSIGCLVHKRFNVAIHRPSGTNANNEWIGSLVRVGQEVTFQVDCLDFNGKIPYIRGKFLKEVPGMRLPAEGEEMEAECVDFSVVGTSRKKQESTGSGRLSLSLGEDDDASLSPKKQNYIDDVHVTKRKEKKKLFHESEAILMSVSVKTTITSKEIPDSQEKGKLYNIPAEMSLPQENFDTLLKSPKHRMNKVGIYLSSEETDNANRLMKSKQRLHKLLPESEEHHKKKKSRSRDDGTDANVQALLDSAISSKVYTKKMKKLKIQYPDTQGCLDSTVVLNEHKLNTDVDSAGNSTPNLLESAMFQEVQKKKTKILREEADASSCTLVDSAISSKQVKRKKSKKDINDTDAIVHAVTALSSDEIKKKKSKKDTKDTDSVKHALPDYEMSSKEVKRKKTSKKDKDDTDFTVRAFLEYTTSLAEVTKIKSRKGTEDTDSVKHALPDSAISSKEAKRKKTSKKDEDDTDSTVKTLLESAVSSEEVKRKKSLIYTEDTDSGKHALPDSVMPSKDAKRKKASKKNKDDSDSIVHALLESTKSSEEVKRKKKSQMDIEDTASVKCDLPDYAMSSKEAKRKKPSQKEVNGTAAITQDVLESAMPFEEVKNNSKVDVHGTDTVSHTLIDSAMPSKKVKKNKKLKMADDDTNAITLKRLHPAMASVEVRKKKTKTEVDDFDSLRESLLQPVVSLKGLPVKQKLYIDNPTTTSCVLLDSASASNQVGKKKSKSEVETTDDILSALLDSDFSENIRKRKRNALLESEISCKEGKKSKLDVEDPDSIRHALLDSAWASKNVKRKKKSRPDLEDINAIRLAMLYSAMSSKEGNLAKSEIDIDDTDALVHAMPNSVLSSKEAKMTKSKINLDDTDTMMHDLLAPAASKKVEKKILESDLVENDAVRSTVFESAVSDKKHKRKQNSKTDIEGTDALVKSRMSSMDVKKKKSKFDLDYSDGTEHTMLVPVKSRVRNVLSESTQTVVQSSSESSDEETKKRVNDLILELKQATTSRLQLNGARKKKK